MTDYRKFRLNKLSTPEFKHLKWLIFWPFFGIMFMTVERLWIRSSYTPIHCALDDRIPFCEYFLIPYLFWFVLLVGMHIYTLLFDTEAFVKMMKFITVSYGTAMLIYIIFPNCQMLRPESFTRDNVFTRFITEFYKFDTNTNVCPSIHVIGSAAAMFAAWSCERFDSIPWKGAFGFAAFMVSISTVFLKQHSVIDIAAAVIVCVPAYIMAFKHSENESEDCVGGINRSGTPLLGKH